MRKASDDRPLGVFDSGVGGLTVMKQIIRELPQENICYLGDTARVPYGTRSAETVIRYSLENAKFLISQGIKALIVACNSSSSVSLDALREQVALPVIGVIEPGAEAAVLATATRKVAVIGTETTIRSGAYEKAIHARDRAVEVRGIACPLFVPLIEEGWISDEVTILTARKYLQPVCNGQVDALVLGCTHYPMIKDVIAGVITVPLIDSAVETAREVKRILSGKNLLRQGNDKGVHRFFVTDSPEKFARRGAQFLGLPITDITKIDIGG